ncbi:MAG: carboxymuconolactone decarboxylase family protein [Propionicimonas sp.]|uniref:carboxymuconolactone decarboxylase family protein n=1 Tax=Propionicimonas sp. TaxID=1955623 RepID=UPI003D0E2717
MAVSDAARANHDRLFGDGVSNLSVTDPELVEYFGNFAFDEVLAHGDVDEHTRLLAVLAALVACQAQGECRVMLGAALTNGVSPVEVKELLYQAVAYLGIGKVLDFLHLTNDVLTARGVELPLPGQSTTTPQTRFDRGWDAQAQIVGEDRLQTMHSSARPEEKHIQDWLTANCFGDHYTRDGIDLVTRELLTFVLLVAHGGCDPQVRGHVAGNLRMGNDRHRLIDVLSQLVPYIGYPRTLNGLAAVNEVAPAQASGE